jgi:hypothetical protein
MSINRILLICALCLSGTAGYFSIVGLASIFASAFVPVVLMSTILEICKLVVTSWLYQNWNRAPGALKSYLIGAVLVLMLITSLGIFGFLSKAHVDMGLNNSELTLRVQQIRDQEVGIQKTIDRYQSQLAQLDQSVKIKLDNNRSTEADALRKTQAPERADIKQKLDAASVSLAQLNTKQADLKSQLQVVVSKVGPIKYVAELFSGGSEVDIDSAVRYMIMMIVVVFDPLAVLMIIASNMSLTKRPEGEPAAAPAPALDVEALATVLSSTMAQALAELKPVVAPPTALGSEPVITRPIVGEVHWDEHTGNMTRWDGSIWVPVSVPLSGAVEPSLVSQGNPIDTSVVQRVVQESMDAWLNSALTDNKSTPREDIKRAVDALDHGEIKPSDPTQGKSAPEK